MHVLSYNKNPLYSFDKRATVLIKLYFKVKRIVQKSIKKTLTLANALSK